jgi:hypothetical protein
LAVGAGGPGVALGLGSSEEPSLRVAHRPLKGGLPRPPLPERGA